MRSGVAQTWCVSLRLFREHAAINFVGQPLRWAQGRLLGGPAPAGRGHGSSLLTVPERGR